MNVREVEFTQHTHTLALIHQTLLSMTNSSIEYINGL